MNAQWFDLEHNTMYVKEVNWKAYSKMREERDRLVVENARLRSCLHDDAENAALILGESAKLKAENKKLRDLVRLMKTHGRDPDIGTDDIAKWYAETYVIERRIKELGIEVD